MDKNAKTILLAIFILLIAIISFNFNDITGQATKSKSVVIVSPKTIQRGEVITATIVPGADGVYNRYAWLYKKGPVNDVRIHATGKMICGKASVCYEKAILKYRISTDDKIYPDGTYYVKVTEHDRRTTTYAQDSFKIER